jgi:hypothetical protein
MSLFRAQLTWGDSSSPTYRVGATLSTMQSTLDATTANLIAMNSSINYLQMNAAMSSDVAMT